MTKYFIAWRSMVTDATGRSLLSFTKADAEYLAAQRNAASWGLLLHWLVPDTAGSEHPAPPSTPAPHRGPVAGAGTEREA